MGKKQQLWTKTLNYRQLANVVNIMLLAIHAYLLITFIVLHVTFMVYVNIASVIAYLTNFHWAKKDLTVFFAVTYLEILLQMILGTVAVGWDCGFQTYGFALILTIYYCDYLARRMGYGTLHPRVISIVVVVIYLILYVVGHHFSPWYDAVSLRACGLLFIVNAAAVFLMMVVYMESYHNIVKQTENRLLEAAEKDELTRMHNRRSMQERLNSIMCNKKVEDEIAIAILDIDDFKMVNDTYGHNAGDLILYEVASKIKKQETDSILACRWGGEEFLLLSVGKTAYQDLVDAISRIVQEIRQEKYVFEEQNIMVTITAGISARENEEHIDHTICRADQYLYEGKKNGKNQFVAKREKGR